MATEKKIIMKQFNGNGYDILYPKVIADQVSGLTNNIYTKNQSVSNATKTKFGLSSSATPDDVLSWLGNYNLYWWKRRVYKPVFEEVKSVETGMFWAKNQTTGKFYVSSSTQIDKYGYGGLVSPTLVSISEGSDADALKGKYVEYSLNNLGDSAIPKQGYVYYIPSDAIFNGYNGSGFIVTTGATQVRSESPFYRVTYKITEQNEWQYVSSSNRNTYPDFGTSGNYEYNYIGQPFNEMLSMPKIQTVYWSGTGVYGKSNPITLSFNFAPKMVCLTLVYNNMGAGIGGGLPTNYNPEVKANFTYFYRSIEYSTSGYLCFYGWEQNKFYIYSTIDSSNQFNSLGYNYMAIAIG